MSERDKAIDDLNRKRALERQKDEQINKMTAFSNNLDKVSKQMEKASNDIFQQAKETARRGQNAMAKNLLQGAARMKNSSENLALFKIRVDCCITQMKAYSQLSALPELVKGIDGFLQQCNLGAITLDMNNFTAMMNGMDNALNELQGAMKFDTNDQFASDTVSDESLSAIMSNFEQRMIAELANETPTENPMSGNATVGVGASVDADADTFAKMLMDESGN